MAPKGAKKVWIADDNDKRTIALTLTVTSDGKVLPFQIIYKGKTRHSFSKIQFPNGFSLSLNLKHHSNTEEAIRHLEDIVITYIKQERAKIQNLNQPALLIWDVFHGQKTDKVTSLLRENNILIGYVLNNMTANFQVLDLTVNKWVKGFICKNFNDWLASKLQEELDAGNLVDQIQIKFQLSTIKPLHANWLIQVYDFLSSAEGKQIILAGCKAAEITGALQKGVSGFSGDTLDPYNDIDPFDQGVDPYNDIDPFDQGEIEITASPMVTPASGEYVEHKRVDPERICEEVDENSGQFLPNFMPEVEMSSDEDEEIAAE